MLEYFRGIQLPPALRRVEIKATSPRPEDCGAVIEDGRFIHPWYCRHCWEEIIEAWKVTFLDIDLVVLVRCK